MVLARALSIIALASLVACELDEAPPDAGGSDASPRDGSADAGAPPDDCPGPELFEGDPAWTYAVRVESSAVFCGLVTEQPLRHAPAKAFKIRLTPGTYRLPEVPGSYQMRLPLCAQGAELAPFSLGAAGPLTLSQLPLGEDAFWLYRLEQSFTLGGAAQVLDIGLDVYVVDAGPPPSVVLDGQREHGRGPDTSVTYMSCGEPCEEPIWFEPCPTPGEGELYAVRFDRGRVELRVRVYPSFGPSGPAALTRASGTLDGVSFVQEDFFKLAHRPDHHNHGGGFFVRFDAPIGDACGLELEVPSRDGGWATLGGRLVDCAEETLEPLTGMALEDG